MQALKRCSTQRQRGQSCGDALGSVVGQVTTPTPTRAELGDPEGSEEMAAPKSDWR